ncbi:MULTISPECIES: hypothetical protein [unclassified Methylococcus]|uniref:hypothetical protein n=1 Tax=unclassified Methylococcus TaxID=2618889 RepID=UPI003D7D47D7
MGKYLPDIRQGDTYRVRIRYPKGTNIAGYVHWLTLRTAFGVEPAALALRSVAGDHPGDQVEEGIAYLEATPSQTAGLVAGKRYVYDVQVRAATGEVRTILPPLHDPVEDRLLVVPEVTTDVA